MTNNPMWYLKPSVNKILIIKYNNIYKKYISYNIEFKGTTYKNNFKNLR
jgi:hypothetical protein